MGWPKLDTRWWNLSMGLAATTAMSACGPTIFLEGEDTITDSGTDSDTDGPDTNATQPTQPPGCMSDADCTPGEFCIDNACVPYYDDYCLDGGCCYDDCCYGGCYYYECYSDYDCGPQEFCFEGYCAPVPTEELPQCGEATLVPLPLPFDELGDSIETLSFVDVEGDGPQELLVGRTTGAQLVLQGGMAAFDLPLPQGLPVVSAAPGDFDADGTLDLAVSDGDALIAILLGDGAGGFVPSSVTPVPVGVEQVFAVHWDSDEQLDLAARTQAGEVAVYIGNGQGELTGSHMMEPDGLVQSIATGRFDGDLLDDLITGSTETTAFFLGNDEGDGFIDAYLQPNEPINGFRHLLAANLDGNDAHEILAWTPDAGGVVLETWTDSGGAYRLHPLFQNGSDGALGDFNGDGALDFVLGGDEHLTLVRGLPGGSPQLFECMTQVVIGESVERIGLGDLDGDGRSEVAVATASGASTRLQLFGFE